VRAGSAACWPDGSRTAAPAEAAYGTEERTGNAAVSLIEQAASTEHPEKPPQIASLQAADIDELRKRHVARRHLAENSPVSGALEVDGKLWPSQKAVLFQNRVTGGS
jgi:hypothetical protein